MQIFIWFPFLLQAVHSYLVGPRQVTGVLGGSATIICFYSNISANIHGRKFLCKMSQRDCDTIISTSGYIAEDHINRTHIEVMKDRFKVQMTQLGTDDVGRYRCGIGFNNNGFYHSVEVMISEASKVPSSTEFIFGTLLDSLTIHCPVLKRSYNHTKYWCKMGKNNCIPMMDSKGFVHKEFWGRSIIQDNKNLSGFLVFINNLQKMDSGFYRCGTGLYDEASDWKDVHIFLSSSKLRPKIPISLNALPGGSVSFKCPHAKEFKTDSVVYCCRWSNTGCKRLIDSSGFVEDEYNGKMHLNIDTTSEKSYSVLITQLAVGDAGLYWCVISDGRTSKILTVMLNILEPTVSFKSHSRSTHHSNIGPDIIYNTLQTGTTKETSISFKPHTSSTQFPNIGPDIIYTKFHTDTIQETTRSFKPNTRSTKHPNIGPDISYTTLQSGTTQETTMPFILISKSTQYPTQDTSDYPKTPHKGLYSNASPKQTSSFLPLITTGQDTSDYPKTPRKGLYSHASPKQTSSFLPLITSGQDTSDYPKTPHKGLYSHASPKQTSSFLPLITSGQDTSDYPKTPRKGLYSHASPKQTSSFLPLITSGQDTSDYPKTPRKGLYSHASPKQTSTFLPLITSGQDTSDYPKTPRKGLYSHASPKQTSSFLPLITSGQDTSDYPKTPHKGLYSHERPKQTSSFLPLITSGQENNPSLYTKTNLYKVYSTTSPTITRQFPLDDTTDKDTSVYLKTSHKGLYSPANPKQTSSFLPLNTTGQGTDVLSNTEQPANTRFIIPSLSLTASGMEVTINSNNTFSQDIEPRNLLFVLIPAFAIGCILIMIPLILIIIKLQRNNAVHIHSTYERNFSIVDTALVEVEQVGEVNELITFFFKDNQDITEETAM
ncbi:uncharacterized protein LOC108708158 isoform X2 [Xenopus laevis]|uniref:Uncharacterized protein LOC108708158 isoform X2 n=1 Tax=Xenopus laevis TaxID=8355 RepID=A0A8J1M8E5_XENLA|nr:uncharacterized protein LOC108708158 isoform X2 [Xenopus laevis]